MATGYTVTVSADARRAHLRVPLAARHGEHETLRGLLHPDWRAASSDGDSATTTQLSMASTTDAAAVSLDEMVRGVVFAARGECTLDNVRKRLAELGVVDASFEDVKKARSKGLRGWARMRAGGHNTANLRDVSVNQWIEPQLPVPSPVERQAHADAVEAFTSNMAAWMHANGVRNPSAAEAARLRLLSDRLQQQAAGHDLEGAVETWLEVQLGAGARPTRLERRQATAKMHAWLTRG